jgi:hypothetical protein
MARKPTQTNSGCNNLANFHHYDGMGWIGFFFSFLFFDTSKAGVAF